MRRFFGFPGHGMVVGLCGALALGVALLMATLAWGYALRPIPMRALPFDLEVERGSVGAALARSLQGQGMALPEWALALALRWRGDAPRIRAGLYAFDRAPSLRELLDRLTRGDASQRDVTIIEGWTFRQVREALARQSELKPLTLGWSHAEILQALESPYPHPEGLFAPDTYAYVKGDSDLDVLRRAYRLQKRRLDRAWQQRAAPPAGPALSGPYEALILASIIEKETARASDRGKVAAVFANRLRIGMRLQSDPTTIYGLGDAFDGNLRRVDLRSDTPWNTYTRAGLPPTPIAMPGRAALEAALRPESISALYFVARGDGTSQFSDDLDSHNLAVQRFQKNRRSNPP
jgi:UPF0755 protein